MKRAGAGLRVKAVGKRLEQVLFAMYRQFPFFAILAEPCDIQLDESGRVATACVDARGSITLGADFLESISDLQLAFLLAHEVSHVAFGHFVRVGSRDRRLWNVANDFVINSMLLECFGRKDAMPAGGLFDPAFDGLTSEQVYERLVRGAKIEDRAALSADMVYETGPDLPGAVSVRQARGTVPTGDGWIPALARAAAQARQYGTLPGGIDREVRSCLGSKVDWAGQLRQFLRQGVSRDGRELFSFIPCNRRFVHAGLYLPALVGYGAPRIAFAIDTSGSMDDAAIAAAHAEVDAIRRQYGCPVYVISADAAVQSGEWVLPFEELPVPRGGGGTDFRPVFVHLADQRIPVDVLVYMTDGYGTFGDEPAIPTIWVMTTDERPPWGEFVQVGIDA